MIEVEGLQAGYGRTAVVRDLSLTVAPGEVVAMLGPNGAGKTTTLLTIAGLLPALGGTVRVLGEPVDVQHPERTARRGLGFVTEDRSLFPGLTVREHLVLAGKDHSLATTYFPKLDELLGRKAGLLSGGEQQMLALARALSRRPKLLMLDEMSLGLAPVIVDRLLPAVRAAATGNGTGVLLVEQNVHLALKIADRGYILSHGELAATGSAGQLSKDSALLAASYLGEAASSG